MQIRAKGREVQRLALDLAKKTVSKALPTVFSGYLTRK
jgi:hypothetical protein